MDAVILAGGKGSRLGGVLPPYMKPFMPIDGVPLVSRVVDQAAGYAGRVFVIVAPENAMQMAHVLEGRNIFMIVQQHATGPGDALLLALALTKEDAILVLMADNIIPDEDIEAVYNAGDMAGYAIGTNKVATEAEARRFTRIYANGAVVEEGPNVTPTDDDEFTVWCGPLVLPVEHAIKALHWYEEEEGAERKIGANLHHICMDPVLVPCESVDIGTPASLMEVQA